MTGITRSAAAKIIADHFGTSAVHVGGTYDVMQLEKDIISLGCDRLLTAGHASNVNDGERTLKELNIKAGDRIIILAGSGVRPGNIARLEASTGCKEFHSSSHGPDGRTSREVVAAMVNYNQ